MKVDPYQVPESNLEEKNSAKFPFIRIIMHVLLICFFFLIFDVVFKDDNQTFREVIYDFFQSYSTITGLIPVVLVLAYVGYKELKEFNTPDSVFVNELDSPKANDAVKALIVLKRRKVDFSPFLPKLLSKLVDKSLMKRSSAYSLIKKYYPYAESELVELRASQKISDLSHCKKVVAPLLERYGVDSDVSAVSFQESESIAERVENFSDVRAGFPHSSEIQVSEKPIGNLSQFVIRLFCFATDLFILVLWGLGIVLAFFVSGGLLKMIFIIGFFALGWGFQSLKISYNIRRFFLRGIAHGNEQIKKCMVTTEKLGAHDKLHLLEDDVGYLFATSDGFKLVTLNGVNHVLEMDSVRFFRVSERKIFCAIDCQDIDGSSIFEFVLNPMYNKWDSDTEVQGVLKFEWFLNHMGIEGA